MSRKYTIELTEMGIKLLHGVFLEGMKSPGCTIAGDMTPDECVEDIDLILDEIVSGYLAKHPEAIRTLQ